MTIYALPCFMIAAGAALMLARRRERDPFSSPIVSDRAKVMIAGCLIFFGLCIFLTLFFPDFKPAPPRKF
jgi:hypothetical protein